MSKYTLIKTIQMELEKINQDIDLKIIKGYNYKKEARRHKFLRKELRELTSKQTQKLTPKQLPQYLKYRKKM